MIHAGWGPGICMVNTLDSSGADGSWDTLWEDLI